MEKQKKQLVKKFHTLLNKAHIDEDGKMTILASYGVASSLDLSCMELLEICDKLDSMSNPEAKEMNVWRKRLMAAIGGYLRAMGEQENAIKIKGIACRAAKCECFNEIPKDRLVSLYNAFKTRKKDIAAVDKLTAEFQGNMMQRAELN